LIYLNSFPQAPHAIYLNKCALKLKNNSGAGFVNLDEEKINFLKQRKIKLKTIP